MLIKTEAIKKLLGEGATKLDIKPGIIELSEFQTKTLTMAASNDGSICFSELESAPTDAEQKKAALDAEMAELYVLVDAGLLIDVSAKFSESVELSRINNNRGFRVFALTPESLLLFRPDPSGKVSVN